MAPSLLSLPVEVRFEIYKHALIATEQFVLPYVWLDRTYDPSDQPEGIVDISLLRVCKQIYAEASIVPYRENDFVFFHPDQLQAFLSQVPAGYQNLLRSVTFNFGVSQYVREDTPETSDTRPIVCEQESWPPTKGTSEPSSG